MPRHPVVSVTVAVALALFSAGCGGSPARTAGADAPSDATPSAVVRFGTFLPLSGTFSAHGPPDRKAMEIAVEEVNEAGGLLGRRLVLDVIDGACDPQTAVAAVAQLIRNKVDVTMGAVCSTSLIPAIPLLRAAAVPHVEPSANSTDLLAGNYDGLFLLIGTVDDEAAASVPWLPALGAKRTAVVHDGTSFALTLARSVHRELISAKRPGPEPLQLNQGALTYAPLVKKILASKADSVFFTGFYAEAGVLVKNLRSAGFTGPVIVGDGSADLSIRNFAGAADMKNLYFVSPPLPTTTPSAAAWHKDYVARAGREPGAFSMQAYTAVKVAAAAVLHAGSTDHAAVRAALAMTDFVAPYGRVTFDARGVENGTGFQLLRIVGSQFERVCPPTCS
jgi:branched-chain amino acid transport system substrate-binding protein